MIQINGSTEKDVPKSDPSISYFTLFRFSTIYDRLLIAVSVIFSIISGLTIPYGTMLVARLFDDMIDYDEGRNAQEFSAQLVFFIQTFPCVEALLLVGGYTASTIMEITAIKQIFKIKEAYLRATLNQDGVFFDTQQTGEIASRMTDDVLRLHEGIGDGVSLFIYTLSIVLGCVGMAFSKGWKLALFCVTCIPISFGFVWFAAKFNNRLTNLEAMETRKASAVAENALSSIQTVYAFNGQEKELDTYRKYLITAQEYDLKKELFSGLTSGLLFLCMFVSYGLNFHFGIYFLLNEPQNYDVPELFAIFFGVVQGMTNIGLLGSLIGSFAAARGAGAHIFNLIDSKPVINPLLDQGIKPESVNGNIEFRDVTFSYPTRPEAKVLQGFNLTVQSGQSVAFVGLSGCGKSTIMQLISRDMDVESGSILVDGYDIRELSVRWLRAQIGLVTQDAVLFNTTVRENIRYGREGATDSEIENAARVANAHQFITKLPDGYDTMVGGLSGSLSGGQKQRIAIARALVRKPAILVLDEAVSGLDIISAYRVQQALHLAIKGRTTFVVAHRLSTIRHVDIIVVLKGGKVVEQGSHDELMKAKGLYYNMLNLQHPFGLEKTQEVADEKVFKESSANTIHIDKASPESDAEQNLSAISFRRLFQLHSPEWKIIAIGSICSFIIGCSGPVFVYLFGGLLEAISYGPEILNQKVYYYSIACFAIGIILAVINVIESLCFGVAGTRLTERLRVMTFDHLLKQEIAFFDKEANSTGALCANLSSEAAYVRRATGQRISLILQGVGAIALALVMSMWYEYRVGVVALAFIPITTIVIYYQGKATFTESFEEASSLEKSTQLAMEVVANARTVSALGREGKFLEEYVNHLRPALGPAKKSAHIRGVVTGLTRSILNLIVTAMLYFGGHLVVYKEACYENVLISTQGVQMATLTLLNIFAFASDFQKGISAATRALALLDKKPPIKDPEKSAITPFVASGDASLENVEFEYPTRPGERILMGLNLEIQRGKTVAIVGESGGGKSTIFSLLERFYDPHSGVVSFDKIPVPQLNRKELRSNLALVTQEPVLFSGTIRENIAYGNLAYPPTHEDIVMAAKQANIHNFIESLPQGYDSDAGTKGSQLSGGQRQRISIARALVRHPRILLLDEATGNLDATSEKLVQDAVTRVKEGRTCVVIAHRLNIVRNADVICVLHRGRIAESGTHDQLMESKGLYYKLHSHDY